MRWQAKPKCDWHPRFAFFPLRDRNNRMVWLEPIWIRYCGMWNEWKRWEERPNDAALPASSSVEPKGRP